jgi:hypothetical protein
MRKIDAIEAFNSRITIPSHNQAAADFAARYGIPGIACSDSHSAFEIAMCFNALPPFTTAEELKAGLPSNDWHGSRSSSLIHLTTRFAVWKNMFDSWRGKRTAAGPILGPQKPADVQREPVQRPTGQQLPPKEADDVDKPAGEAS